MITFTSLSPSLPVDAEGDKQPKMKDSGLISSNDFTVTIEENGIAKHYEWNANGQSLTYKVFKDGENTFKVTVKGQKTFHFAMTVLKNTILQ